MSQANKDTINLALGGFCGLLLIAVYSIGYIHGRETEEKIWNIDSETVSLPVYCHDKTLSLEVTAPCHIETVVQYERKQEESNDK